MRQQLLQHQGQNDLFNGTTSELAFMPSRRVDIDTLLAQAVDAVSAVFMENRPAYVPFSAGKDSGCTVDITLRAALRAKSAGATPFVVVGHADTLVENPEIKSHARNELAKMTAFAKANGIDLTVGIVSPTLATTWQMSVLTGRALPSFPGVHADCTINYKLEPQIRLRKHTFAAWQARGLPEPVTILGTRFEESTVRAGNMRKRGESATTPVRNKDGHLVLSPIAHWTEEDVFELLGNIGSGLLASYSCFKETFRIYAHSAGSNCAVLAMDTHAARKSPGCGSRHGCWSCVRVDRDASLESMIEFDQRYEYARGLNKLNTLLHNTRHDWTRRHWIGRTIRGGYIEIKPDTYGAGFLRDLTRYVLQLDYDEKRRAQRAGERPKFQIMPLETMIGVDAVQNLNGLARPFQIWADYRDIHERGIRYDIPDVEPIAPTPVPETRYLYVGNEWDDGSAMTGFTGLRSDYLEALSEDRPCVHDLKTLRGGARVWDLPHAQEFSINPESAIMLEDFEMERMLQIHAQNYNPGGITLGYKWYANFGCLVLSHGQVTKHDEVLRRTSFKDRLGLTLDFDLRDLLAQSVSFRELPPSAQERWGVPVAQDTLSF